MTSSIIQFLALEKLIGDNYVTWKSNLNTILTIDDLRFILTEECPPIPSSNSNQIVWEAFDRWIRANDKARAYILASLSNVLVKKHEDMSTAKEIMESLRGMYGQPSFILRHDAIKYVCNSRMKEETNAFQTMLRTKGLEPKVNVASVEKRGMSTKPNVASSS
ncbi:uncharacterized protein LOC120073638 [Benincasa hispida]|uniref:uncharacterized protein LOC120073638 n=1 Tax=Benincasa hispida TaxID=102211 RepID=UPI001900AB7A|nr:uncharacterized protein LOC120073638 [Benincasa hispida]